MKKILTFVLFLLFCLGATAENVNLATATKAARNWFDSQSTRGGSEPRLVWTGNYQTRGPLAPAFYVFNNPDGGWMVVAGENTGRPILAWSDKGSFVTQDMPESISSWFDEYAYQIDRARAQGVKQSPEAAAEWNNLLSGHLRRATSVVSLGTPTWGQGNPYNLLCPRIDNGSISYTSGTTTYTGCVATAMAEIMYYHRHPAQGTGTIGGYSKYVAPSLISSTTAPEIDLDSDSGYDWDSMTPTKPTDDGAKAAVAKLMYHCGLSVEMQYGTSGSSASTIYMAKAFLDHMKYDTSLAIYYRNDLNDSEWLNLLKNEFDNSRPVVFAGRNSENNSGHSFVGEGYDSDGNILINWGWNATNNGYFAPGYFKTTPGDSSSGDYRYGLFVLTNIKPNVSGSGVYQLFIMSDFSLSADIDFNSPNYPFGITVGIGNASTFSVPAAFRVYLCSYGNTQKGVCKTVTFSNSDLGAFGYYYPPSTLSSFFSECKMQSLYESGKKPRLGDKLMMAIRTNGSDYSLITSTQGETSINNNIPVYDIPFIAVKDGGVYSVGDYFDLAIVNSRTAPSDMTVSWTFDGDTVALDQATGKGGVKLTSAGEHTVKAVVTIGEETRTITQKILVE